MTNKWSDNRNNMSGLELINSQETEAIKKKYEKKINLLIEHIKKMKHNNDFFNYNVDNDILTSKS